MPQNLPILELMELIIAPFTLALKPVSNRFTFKPVWTNHIHYVVYRKRFPKCIIRGVYTAALSDILGLNQFETALSASVNGIARYSKMV